MNPDARIRTGNSGAQVPRGKEQFYGTMQAWQYRVVPSGTSLSANLYMNVAALRPSKVILSKSQLIVQVLAMSPNPADYKIPEMALGFAQKLFVNTPASPGMDFCGQVQATHAANDQMVVGQVVFGRLGKMSQFGTLGQFIVTDMNDCVPLPDGVDPIDAAAVGTTALTAYQSIVPHIRDRPHKPLVFINGGSGGTGTWGIQFAKIFGAKVIVSCSKTNADFVRDLGADEVIDYTEQDVVATLKAKGEVLDLIVDNVGSSPANLYEDSEHYLKAATGRYVQVGGNPSLEQGKQVLARLLKPGFLGGGKRPFSFMTIKNSVEDLTQILRWMEEGKAKAVVSDVFEWEHAPKAFDALKTGRTRGNLVVRLPEVAQPSQSNDWERTH